MPRSSVRKAASPALPPCAAVIVAAGSSSRMGGKVRKPYLKLRGRPILSWTVQRLGRTPNLRQIVLVTRPEDRARAARAARQARLPKTVELAFAAGGARRQDSVFNGLRATTPAAEVVLVHDAARPFPPPEAVCAAVAAAARAGGAILAIPVRDTVKRQRPVEGEPRIEQTVPRAHLWQAQTPQVFRRALLLELFEKLARTAPDVEVTDDAAVCERFGHAVVLIEASLTNLKITRPEDLPVAEALLKQGLV
jgi:2-C-methyl-D-erythritol 4-phosphate cytidylyltransferase